MKIFKDLDTILQQIPANKLEIASNLIDELSFLKETLSSLKTEVKNGGATQPMRQGQQSLVIESAALKAYNNTLQRYSVLFKQLTDLMTVEAAESNAVLDFIAKGS